MGTASNNGVPPAPPPRAGARPSFTVVAGVNSQPAAVPDNRNDVWLLPAFLQLSPAKIRTNFLDLEWQQRRRLQQATNANTTTGRVGTSPFARITGDVIIERDRYMNLSPFASNRIRLDVPEEHNDYINASPIRLTPRNGGPENYYIATQGPKADSYSHIWRMVSRETGDPAFIVMLTPTHDDEGHEKCFQYFPDSMEDPWMLVNAHDEFGDGKTGAVTLKSITEDVEARSTIRELELHISGARRKTVWLLLFEAWPDYVAPKADDRRAVINAIRILQRRNSPGSPPIVHCSAGVGRTGTFIALHHLLSELDSGALDDISEGEDPIFETVEELRKQRMMMVQSERQLSFLYAIIRELWLERLASKSS